MRSSPGWLLFATACQISPLYYPGEVPARVPPTLGHTGAQDTDTDTDTVAHTGRETGDTSALVAHSGSPYLPSVVVAYPYGVYDNQLPCSSGEPTELRSVVFHNTSSAPWGLRHRLDDCSEVTLATVYGYTYQPQSLPRGGAYIVRRYGVPELSLVLGDDAPTVAFP